MTLVVTHATETGLVLVGDSAGTFRQGGERRVLTGYAKVHYHPFANVGITAWGNAVAGPTTTDYWLAAFVQAHSAITDIDTLGTTLARELNALLTASGEPWSALRRGFHLAGYRNGQPCIWHVHTGDHTKPQHELRLYRDYPDDNSLSAAEWKRLRREGLPHLRNGQYPLFGILTDHMIGYALAVRKELGIPFPGSSLESRLAFFKLLVGIVADTYTIAGQHPSVGGPLSALVITPHGLHTDERLPVSGSPGMPASLADISFDCCLTTA